MFEITRAPIDPEPVIASVRSLRHGAVVTFFGTVRDLSEGRAVVGLEYDAYPEMAEEQMKGVGGEIAGRWPDVTVGMVHRIGRLEIGDIAVVIAVSSPHRKVAFEACHYAIDRIKKVVPIWKKELYRNGEEWKSG